MPKISVILSCGNYIRFTCGRHRSRRHGFALARALETPISFTLMVHHIVLYRLKPEVTPARVEEMMMNARMQLLKIPEVLSIKCGKRIDPEIGLAILHRHRFRVDGQIFHLLRRLDLREIRGGSDQAEHGGFAGARFRDGSGQRRAVFVIVAAARVGCGVKGAGGTPATTGHCYSTRYA